MSERKASALLGVSLGLLVGCGLLGLGGLGVVVYFAAWCGSVLDRFGDTAGKAGMLVGFFLGFALYGLLWAGAGWAVTALLTHREKPES